MATETISCKVCGHEEKDFIGNHILETHQLSIAEYLDQHPGAPTVSQRLMTTYRDKTSNVRRAHPPKLETLKITFAKFDFAVNTDVDEGACLPMPDHYRVPANGTLGGDIQHAAIALQHRRSMYIWGMPGSGKDAFFHAWSAMTRTPAIFRQVKPGTDIEAWFFSRGFNEKETLWEEGEVLKGLRDGYLTSSGRRLPYLFLVTDFDRADREQAENLRLITDSIQGRIDGPAGRTYRVFPGTIIAVTANTAGSGDDRGRMISANPLDASILDRFERKFNFRWMDWKDEEPILKAKFPTLVARCPSIFAKVGGATKVLRDAILDGKLYAEFSHRALCSILGHASDILDCSGGKLPKNLLKLASRAWLDGLPDKDNQDLARNMMDPHFTALEEGNTNHISDEPLNM